MEQDDSRKCLYEVLGVAKFAKEDEIKKAYRSLALKFHPDKSPTGKEIEYKEIFQQINDAYQILSNPQERAWYDDHREQYINPNKKEENYFGFTFDINACCFDNVYKEKGFYQFYEEIFQKILIEEEKYRQNSEELYDNRESFLKAPNFGDEKSFYENVEKFYAYWDNFVTCQNFAWADLWDDREGDNRREKRFIQKTNLIERKKAKRKYNMLLNKLISFVKFRDDRYTQMIKIQKEERIQKEKEQQEQQERKEREWQEKKEKLLQEELAKYEREREERVKNGEIIHTEEEEELENDIFECKLCDKEFKSENQLMNHNKSKQHLKVKKKMMREVAMEGEENFIDDVQKELDELKIGSQKKNKKKKKNKKQEKTFEEIKEEDIDEEQMKAEKEREEQFNKEREEQEKLKKEKKEKKQQKKMKKTEKKKQQELVCKLCAFKGDSKTKLHAHLRSEHNFNQY